MITTDIKIEQINADSIEEIRQDIDSLDLEDFKVISVIAIVVMSRRHPDGGK